MANETSINQALTLAAAEHGEALWRNNSGAFKNDNGQWVRYGLGNTSKQLNDKFKSSDHIGITRLLIEPKHVGFMVGVFTAVETKKLGFKGPISDHEMAQAAFHRHVLSMGGLAGFVTSVDDYYNLIKAVK